MRIAVVSHYYPPHVGGVEAVARHQARVLASRGHDVDVLTSAVPRPVGTTVEDGARVHRLAAWNPVEGRGVPFPVPSIVGFARAARAARRVELIHAHDLLYPTTWLAAIWSLVARVPLVVHQHVAVIDHPSRVVVLVQRLVYATAGRLVLRRASRVFHLNSRVEAMLRGLGASDDQLCFLANGLDDETFRPCRSEAERRRTRAAHGLPEEGLLAVFVARPVPKKGYPVLRSAFEAVRPGAMDLVTVGGHADPVGSPVSERVHHLGPLEPAAVAEVMRACDVFCLPSVSEGFPLTVQEAMASGLAVVTTDDPGYDAYGLDRSRVRLVEPTASAVGAVLADLAAHPLLVSAMATYSVQYATARFSWARHAQELEEAYTSVVRRQRRGEATAA